MHTAEEVRKEAEALDAGRIRERDTKEILLAYADLLEAMEELDKEAASYMVGPLAIIKTRAAETRLTPDSK